MSKEIKCPKKKSKRELIKNILKKKYFGNAFTLIELLAVIIILGILMIIAIPSVTEYIQNSRKDSYIKIAQRYIDGTSTAVNSAKLPMYDTNSTYYVPISCISLEKGGDSPYGDWKEAYVVVTYDGDGYDYYWTSYDSSNMGIELTYRDLLNTDSVITGMNSIDKGVSIGDREKILLLGDDCSVDKATEVEITTRIEEETTMSEKAFLAVSTKTDVFSYTGITRDSVESITFVSNRKVSNTAIHSWDASDAQDGGIIAWYEDSDSDNKYEVYVGGNGEVYANPDSSYLFYGYTYLDSINDIELLNTTMATNMSGMFQSTGYRSTIFTLNLGNHFDTSNVTNMSNMFNSISYNNANFTLDLGDNFDTSNVTDMSSMFAYAGDKSTKFTLDLKDKFNTSNVVNMSRMFYQSGYTSTVFTLDLGDNFDTSNVTDMTAMFAYAGYNSNKFTLDLKDKFNTSKVTTMVSMFSMTGRYATNFTLDLGDNFDTSNVTNMDSMFEYAGYNSSKFTLDLKDKFNTSNVTSMKNMFSHTASATNATNFTLDLGDNFDTSKVTNMSLMFYRTGRKSTKFTLDLGDKFDTSNVTNMYGMFIETGYTSNNFALDLGDKFDTSKVTEMTSMFESTGYFSPVFTLDLGDKFNTSNVTDMRSMFEYTGYRSTKFALDLKDKFDTSKVTTMSSMFKYTGFNSPVFTLDLGEKFNTSNVTDMQSMFEKTGYYSNIFTLNLGDKFDTSKVTNTSAMFMYTGYSSTRFTLDLKDKFDTSKVNNMNSMFQGLGYYNVSFTLDLGENFYTTKVEDFGYMFANTRLGSIYMNKNIFKNNANYSNIFYSTGYATVYVKTQADKSLLDSYKNNSYVTIIVDGDNSGSENSCNAQLNSMSKYSQQVLSTAVYYVSDSVTYSNGVYKLVNPQSYTWGTSYQSLVGKYTTMTSNPNGTYSSIPYISATSSGSVEYVILAGGVILEGCTSEPEDDNESNSCESQLAGMQKYTSNVSSTTVYYASDSVTYSNGMYTLVNPQPYTWGTSYQSLVGKYTTMTSNPYTEYSTIPYITSTSSTSHQFVILGNGVILENCFQDSGTEDDHVCGSGNNFPDLPRTNMTMWSGNVIYYSDTVIYENGYYRLSNPKQYTWGIDYLTMVGKYVSYTINNTSGDVPYVVDANTDYLTVVYLTGGEKAETCPDVNQGSCAEQVSGLSTNTLNMTNAPALYYSDTVVYINGVYRLADPKLYTWSTDYNSLIGKYTFMGTSINSSGNPSIPYIVGATSSQMTYVVLTDGKVVKNCSW